MAFNEEGSYKFPHNVLKWTWAGKSILLPVKCCVAISNRFNVNLSSLLRPTHRSEYPNQPQGVLAAHD